MSETALPRIGFIGSGKMASALLKGLLEVSLARADQLIASDPVGEVRQALAEATGITVTADNHQVMAFSDLVVLAVKPQSMPAVMEDIRPALKPSHLIVSIAAGITLNQLTGGLGFGHRVVRVMPNTPALVGAGAAAYCMGPHASHADGSLVRRLLSAVGLAYEVPEKLLDAITGLSGSGPAYVAVVIEALSDGGVRMGLPRDIATSLAAQTVLGTAKMVLETGLHPAVLKDNVASPGGTTIAGLHALERGGLRAALIDAVEAATRRAIELGSNQ